MVSQMFHNMPTSMNSVANPWPIETARRVARTGSMVRLNTARNTRPPSIGYAGSRLNSASPRFAQTRLRGRFPE